jgi:AcrR family transcriptional regulator
MPADSRRGRGRPPDRELPRRRRDQILGAAAGFFARHGFHDADVQLLADRIGIGKGTIYRYFPTKKSLFLATVDRVMQLLRAHVDAARRGGGDALGQIERAMIAYLAFFDAHPEYVELLILERAVFRDRKTPTYFEHRRKNRREWVQIFNDLMAQGRVRAMPAATVLDVLGRAIYGTMFTNFFAGRTQPFKTQARNTLDILFHGIMAEGGANGRVLCRKVAR